MRRGESGFGMILLVMLVAVAGLILAGSVTFFSNAMRQTNMRINQAKALYLAQAGVMRAAWDWYESNTTIETSRRWAPIETTVTGNQIFKAGMDSAGNHLQSNYAYYTSTSDPIITYVQNINTNQSKSTGTTLAITTTAAVSLGNYIVVYFAMDGAAGAVTCADTDGNSYTPVANAQFATPGTGNVRTTILSAPVTNALEIGDTITVTHPSVAARAMSASEFANVNALDQTAAATGSNSTGPTTGNVSTTYREELLIGSIGVEGVIGDTFTAGTGYLTNPPTRRATSGGADATNVTIDPEYRIVGSSGSYLANATITSRDWAIALATFSAIPRWVTSGSDRRLRLWQIFNINNGNSITLTQMKVSWTGGGPASLTEIRLNNTPVWTGTGSSGDLIDIGDTAIPNGGNIGGVNTWLQWNNSGPADPVTVTCQFYYSGDSSTTDAKSDEVILWNGVQAGGGLPLEKTFSITSTGQIDQTGTGSFKILETAKTSLSSTPGLSSFELTDWDEGDKNIP